MDGRKNGDDSRLRFGDSKLRFGEAGGHRGGAGKARGAASQHAAKRDINHGLVTDVSPSEEPCCTGTIRVTFLTAVQYEDYFMYAGGVFLGGKSFFSVRSSWCGYIALRGC